MAPVQHTLQCPGKCWQPGPLPAGPLLTQPEGRHGTHAAPLAQGQCPELRGTISILPWPRAVSLLPSAAPRPGTGRRPHGAIEAVQSQVCRWCSCTLLPSPAKGQMSLLGPAHPLGCGSAPQDLLVGLHPSLCTPIRAAEPKPQCLIHPLIHLPIHHAEERLAQNSTASPWDSLSAHRWWLCT